MHEEPRVEIQGRALLAVTGLVAWLGIVLTFWLTLQWSLRHNRGIADALIGFFSYLTVLTNLFVALSCSLPLVLPAARVSRWLASGMVRGCFTTAILLVCIAYHLLLRSVWAPEGLQWVGDITMHYVVPILMAACWLWYPGRERLPLWAPLAWCLYPIIYFAFLLIRGALLSSYPYYFMNVRKLGYAQVLLNASGIWAAFLVLGLVMFGLARFRMRGIQSALADR